MAQQVSDYVLQRLREWGIHRVFGCPGGGINGMGPGAPYAIAARFAYPHRPVIAFVGDGAFPGSQSIPDFPYAKYAELAGLKGIYCDQPEQVTGAWQEALASDRPVVLEFVVDSETAPIPPHIMKEQAVKTLKAGLHDPDRTGTAARGFRQEPTEVCENLPGRKHG